MEITRQELDQILDSDKSFSDYVTQHDNALDACTIELMQAVYSMDGDAMSDEELLNYYADILATRSHVMNYHA
jgi:hypothetical protein